MSRTALWTVTFLVILRELVGSAHGYAHHELMIPLSQWQQVFINVVIAAGPFVGLAALWWWRSAVTAWFLAAIIAAGSLFGIYFHFGPVTPDHVTALPDAPGRMLFIVTAVLLVMVELPCVAYLAWLARSVQSQTAPA